MTGEALVALTYVLLKENPIAVGAVSSAIITLAAGLMNKVGQTRDNFHDSFWLKPWRTSGQDPNEQIETPIYHKN